METRARQQITEGVIWKQLLIFFFPILMGTFFQQMYNTVDTIIVGRLVGTEALAAVGATGPLVSMVNGFFIGVSSGATVVLSQAYGAGDRKGVSDSIHTGVALSLLLGVMLTAIGICLGGRVMGWMGTPENCMADATTYLRIYFAGSIGTVVYNMGAGILRAMGDSKRPMLFLMVTCILNVVLLRQKEDRLELRKLRIERSLLGRILRIGIPAGLQFVTFDFSNVLIQSGINSFGDITMAAWTSYGKTDALVWMISGAFGVSITTFVGQNFGAQKYGRIRQGAWTCLALSIAMVCALNVTLLLFRSQILGIYTDNPEVIAVGSMVMLSIMPYEFLFMPIEVFAGTMRGVGNSLMPTLITGSCVCLFRVVWLMTAVRHWHSLKTLTLSYPLSWALAAAVFLAVYFKGNWLRRRIVQCGMEAEVR